MANKESRPENVEVVGPDYQSPEVERGFKIPMHTLKGGMSPEEFHARNLWSVFRATLGEERLRNFLERSVEGGLMAKSTYEVSRTDGRRFRYESYHIKP